VRLHRHGELAIIQIRPQRGAVVRFLAAAIRAPTFVYVGALDNPEPKEQGARLLPNAEFVALDGLDHAQAMNRADLVLPHAMAFLADLATNGSGAA
jgi:pimeloyl-ACP methyl ester carboxylesterase